MSGFRLPIESFEDAGEKFVAFRTRFFKTGEYRDSEVVQVVEVDGVEYMQLPSYTLKMNPQFADVEGGKEGVLRAVKENRLYFLNEEGEIVAARFKGDVLVADTVPKKVGYKVRGFYQYEGVAPGETREFINQVKLVCAAFHVTPKIRVSTEGETTKVWLSKTVFKQRSGAQKALQEMRGLMPCNSNGKRVVMKLTEKKMKD